MEPGAPAGTRLRPDYRWVIGAVLAYLAFGVAWILGSDALLAMLDLSPRAAQVAAVVKGLVFVLISAGWGLALLRLSQPLAAPGVPPQSIPASADRLIGLLLASVLIIPVINAGIYLVQGVQLENEAGRSLQAVSTLRAEQITQWMDERRRESRALIRDPQLLQALRDNAATAELERHLLDLALRNHYVSIELIAADGRLLSNVGEHAELDPSGQQLDSMLPLGDDRVQGRIHVHADGSAALLIEAELSDGDEPLGSVAVHVQLDRSLAPMLSAGSDSRESTSFMLLHRDSSRPMLLRPAWPGASGRLNVEVLPLRWPLAELEGAAEGKASWQRVSDHRGVAVIVAQAPIGESRWMVLAQIDRSVVRSDLLPLMAWVSGILFVALVAMAALLVQLWRQQRHIATLHAAGIKQESDRLLQQFFDMPFVGIAFTSPGDKRWLRFNDRLCEILGYRREQLERMSWSEVTHPDDLAADVAQFERLMRGESEGYALEKRFVRADGGVVHTYIDLRCLRRPDRSIEVIIATIDDVSHEHEARQALLHSEARWRRIVEEAPFPIVVHDDRGRIQALSRAWTELSGYSAAELPDIDAWLQLASPDPVARARVQESIARLFATTDPVDEGEFDIRCADGSHRVWMFRTMNLGGGVDGLQVAVSMAADVTEQRRLAADLRTNFELYRHLFDANPACMYVWDSASLRILAANDAVVARYGWTRAELLGMSIEQLRPKCEVEHLHGALGSLSRDHLNHPGIFVHQRRDGSTLKVEVSVHPMAYEGREAWLAMAVDVSERELARAEREGYIRQLEEAAGRTLEVVSTMVELRDPYTAGHERRVGELAASIAAEMGLDEAFQQGLRMCGAVHDVGKIGVPAEILSKPTRLSKAEYQMVQQHAAQGYEILKSIELPWPLAEVARQHHERMDGSGYPRGLNGEDILLEARIIAIADVVESMGSHRPYRPAIGPALAMAEIEAGRGRLYDLDAANACLRLFREKGYTLPT